MPEKSNDKRSLFTVILEYQGTTSLSQFRAADPNSALEAWVDGLNRPEDFGLTEDQGVQLRRGFEIQDEPTEVDGLENVWCAVDLADSPGLALIHIVKTHDPAGNP